MRKVERLRLIVVFLLPLALAASGCDTGGDDPIIMFGPSPEIRISTNPDVIAPGERSVITVQVLNNGIPAVGEVVLLGVSGGRFVPEEEEETDPGEEEKDLVGLYLITDEQGIAMPPALFEAETIAGPNTSGIARITATAMGVSKTVELRLFIAEPAPAVSDEGAQ